jgi:hypothetical protein
MANPSGKLQRNRSAPSRFQGFRLLLEKAEDFDELKVYVETLAFKLLG